METTIHTISKRGNTADLETQTYLDHSKGWNILIKDTHTSKYALRIACRNELQAKKLHAMINDSCFTEDLHEPS